MVRPDNVHPGGNASGVDQPCTTPLYTPPSDVVSRALPHDLLYFGYKPMICKLRREPLQTSEFDQLELRAAEGQLEGAIIIDMGVQPSGELDKGSYLMLQYLRADRFVVLEGLVLPPIVYLVGFDYQRT